MRAFRLVNDLSQKSSTPTLTNRWSLTKLLCFSVFSLLCGWGHLAQSEPPAMAFDISPKDFKCMTEMTPVRGFYVDNLLGDLEATLAVANSPTGGAYPPGSVVQLIPTEVMVKHPKGTSPATKDWEFFELGVDAKGTNIDKRGFVDVVNKFGGNCFACHVQAKPQWDLICEKNHGCEPIPITSLMTRALQKSDPRCSPANPLSTEEVAALKQLQEMLKQGLPTPNS